MCSYHVSYYSTHNICLSTAYKQWNVLGASYLNALACYSAWRLTKRSVTISVDIYDVCVISDNCYQHISYVAIIQNYCNVIISLSASGGSNCPTLLLYDDPQVDIQ